MSGELPRGVASCFGDDDVSAMPMDDRRSKTFGDDDTRVCLRTLALPMLPSNLMIARDDWVIKVGIDVDCCFLLPASFEADDDDDAMFAMPSSYNGVWYVISPCLI